MFFQLLFGLFIGYLLFNFIFRFVVPVIRFTTLFRKQIRTFKQQQTESNAAADGFASATKHQTAEKGDYIDFEDLK